MCEILLKLAFFSFSLDKIYEQRTRLHEQPPHWKEMFSFLKCKSKQWSSLGICIGLGRRRVDELHECYSLTNEQRMERVLKLWVTTRSAPLNWDFFIRVLEDRGFLDVKEVALKFLEKEEAKYENK